MSVSAAIVVVLGVIVLTQSVLLSEERKRHDAAIEALMDRFARLALSKDVADFQAQENDTPLMSWGVGEEPPDVDDVLLGRT